MEITNLTSSIHPDINTTVVLNWTNPVDENFAGANVYQDGVLISTALILDETFTVSELIEGTTYTFLVTTVDAVTSEESVGVEATITVPEPVSTVPEAPTNLTTTVNDDIVGVGFTWEHPNITSDIMFKLYLNDVATSVFSNDSQLQIADLIAGKVYSAHIVAVNRTTLEESLPTNTVTFEIKGLTGSDDPKNWIGVKLDNLTVIYQK